jgi:FkbM family methyltransferase
MIGKRDLGAVQRVLGRKETYTALARALVVLESPLPVIWDEVFARSSGRPDVGVRTPIGKVRVQLSDRVDLSTVFGVFCRADYRCDSRVRVAVDIGANIGVASLYFLTRNAGAIVHAYEPVPRNAAALATNTARFAQRLRFHQVAVGTRSGTADFAVEPTGKFGGLTAPYSERIQVECVAINDLLERVLSEHGRIDCLKIDVEGTERDLLAAVAPEHWQRIACIYAEHCDSRAFLPANFRRSYRYNVERLERVGG